MNWIISPAPPLTGSLRVPGDKSISHRLAMMAAISDGVSHIDGFLNSDDCLRTLRIMEQLGAVVERQGETIVIKGTAGNLNPPQTALDCGNSGTGMRLLAGLLAGFPVASYLVGDASLHTRPMSRILEPLSGMGAHIVAEGRDGRPPLAISGRTLKGISYQPPIASAQVKSCLMLAALRAEGELHITEPVPSRDHTERLFRALELPVRQEGKTIILTGSAGKPPLIRARDWNVPGDISSAAFWLVAAAIQPNADITLSSIGLNPSRTAILDVLAEMGADLQIGTMRYTDWEPQADIRIRGSRFLKETLISGKMIPNLIDEIPILSVAAAFAQGVTRIRDAAELRVKESDRIESTSAMLRSAGVPVKTYPDGLDIEGGAQLKPAVFDSFGDHRIAMAAAVMGLMLKEDSQVRNTGCVDASYPEFVEQLLQIAPDCCRTVNLI